MTTALFVHHIIIQITQHTLHTFIYALWPVSFIYYQLLFISLFTAAISQRTSQVWQRLMLLHLVLGAVLAHYLGTPRLLCAVQNLLTPNS